MSSGFQHSVKVPTQYRNSAKILKNAIESKKSLKSLLYEEKHIRVRGAQAVLKHYIDNRVEIEAAINKSQILQDNPRLCPSLCRILVTELIYGRKQLIGESKPVQTVRQYLETFQEYLKGGESSAERIKKGTYFWRCIISISQAI